MLNRLEEANHKLNSIAPSEIENLQKSQVQQILQKLEEELV